MAIESLEQEVLENPERRDFFNTIKNLAIGYAAVKGVETIAKTTGIIKGVQAIAGTYTMSAVEEFLEENPNAVVALSTGYFENGYNNKSTSTSGLVTTDKFAKSGNQIKSAKELYNSGILSKREWSELLKKADNTIDLLIKEKEHRYGKAFARQETIPISKDKGYKIIRKLFGGKYDGMNIQEVDDCNPVFILQLSTEKRLYLDNNSDVAKRPKGQDPTPPYKKNIALQK